MKCLLFVLLTFTAVSDVEINLDAIAAAVKKGDAAALSSYFDQEVEVSIKDEAGFYSKSEATGLVQKFFAQHKPTGFSQVHNGSSPGDAQYCIGNLTTANGTFRVYIYIAKKGAKEMIQEIRFDKN